MSNRVATVVPDDGLNLRSGPSASSAIIALLEKGQQVTIKAAADVWRQVDTAVGSGFVHSQFITVDGRRMVAEEPPGLDPPLVVAGSTAGEPGATAASTGVSVYTVLAGDTLSGIGAKLGVAWPAIAAVNGLTEPFALQPGQVLRLPGSPSVAAIAAPAGFVEILNPLQTAGVTCVTSSSAQGHHTPYGGTRSVDLAILGSSSQGLSAQFNVRAEAGREVRGRVLSIANACASGLISDGGHRVQVGIQTRVKDGPWQDSAAWVLYAHLDPVAVSAGQILEVGALIGKLGPAEGGEYNSTCAQGSHTHVEASRASNVVDQDTRIGAMPVMQVQI